MLKVCSNHSIVQYVDYMRGPIKEGEPIKEGGPSNWGGPERSLRSHPLRSITDRARVKQLQSCGNALLLPQERNCRQTTPFSVNFFFDKQRARAEETMDSSVTAAAKLEYT